VTDAARALPRRRVAVTGLGVKAPAGTDLESYWAAVKEGRPSAGPIRRFDASVLPEQFRFACEVPEFDLEPYFDFKEARRADRCTHLGVAAALDAINDAGLRGPNAQPGELGTDPARCGVYTGSGVGGLMSMEEQDGVLRARGSDRVSPFLVPAMMANATAATAGMKLGWTGPNLCVSTACAAGTHAIGEAGLLIRYGMADVMLAGGTEASITPLAMSAFGRMGALSSRVHDMGRASRPFDPDRDGFVMGEGAGFLVLEEWDHAVARGARIYGELLGYARNTDAYHITAPVPGGAGAAACMQQALADAGLEPSQVAHVNAHGTSTPLNDASEAQAMVKVFGERAVPVTSGKGVTGHLVAGAGAIEAVATFLALRDGVVAPTANHERDDPELAIDVVAGEARPVPPGPVVSNSFGFGGHNATVVLGPPDPRSGTQPDRRPGTQPGPAAG
jgi:3-oxoacyl-[acyl-carrier-protein] synthase II